MCIDTTPAIGVQTKWILIVIAEAWKYFPILRFEV